MASGANMQIVVLVAFMVVLTLLDVPVAAAPAWALAAASAVYLLATGVLTALSAGAAVATSASAGAIPPAALRRHSRLVGATQVWLLVGLAGLMLMGLGRWVMEDLLLGAVPLVGTLATMVPFFAALVVMWLLDWPFHRLLRQRLAAQAAVPVTAGWSRGQYLLYNLRHHLLFIAVPVGLIVLGRDVLFLYVLPVVPDRAVDAVALVAMPLYALAVFLAAPAMIVHIWKTRPLPAGALRDALEAMAKRLRLRFRRLLEWVTSGIIANAGVMGLIPQVRYVLLSDALLAELEPRQIEAIFAHEAGHILSHHIFYFFLFVVSSVVLCQTPFYWLGEAMDWPIWLPQVPGMMVLAGVWWLLLGWLSRRFERQSDVLAAWAVSEPTATDGDGGPITPEGAATFASALERVAAMNGIPPRRNNWRHGSVARRVSHVLWLAATGQGRAGIDRLVRRCKIALWAATAVAAGVGAWEFLWRG